MKMASSTGQVIDPTELAYLLTVDEVAALLRTTRKAIYARAERGLLPGAVRDGRRLLVRRDELLRSLVERDERHRREATDDDREDQAVQTRRTRGGHSAHMARRRRVS